MLSEVQETSDEYMAKGERIPYFKVSAQLKNIKKDSKLFYLGCPDKDNKSKVEM